jgi:hypothetical protein
MAQYNNWNVSFSAIQFFERIIGTHKAVESFRREQDILFRVGEERPLAS